MAACTSQSGDVGVDLGGRGGVPEASEGIAEADALPALAQSMSSLLLRLGMLSYRIRGFLELER